MNKIQEFLGLKALQAQGWTEKKATEAATRAINHMSIHDQAKLSLLTIRAVGIPTFRAQFIGGFEKEFADEVAKNKDVTIAKLTDKYFAERRFNEVLQKLCMVQDDIKSLARRAGAKE